MVMHQKHFSQSKASHSSAGRRLTVTDQHSGDVDPTAAELQSAPAEREWSAGTSRGKAGRVCALLKKGVPQGARTPFPLWARAGVAGR